LCFGFVGHLTHLITYTQSKYIKPPTNPPTNNKGVCC
jgi:hypothetical protein